MRIVCPDCRKTQEIIPDELIGRCAVCKGCHAVFLWHNVAISRKCDEIKISKERSGADDMSCTRA